MKRCSQCQQDRPESAFSRRRRSPDGLQSWCKECARARRTDWYENRGGREITASQRQENIEERRAADRKYYEQNKRAWAVRNREQRFGVPIEELEAMWEAQHRQCAICCIALPDFWGRSTHIDHDHRTGRVRGILCQRCNLMLGHADDRPAHLMAAIAYLDRGTAWTRVAAEVAT